MWIGKVKESEISCGEAGFINSRIDDGSCGRWIWECIHLGVRE
jgi:hypothetical protein